MIQFTNLPKRTSAIVNSATNSKYGVNLIIRLADGLNTYRKGTLKWREKILRGERARGRELQFVTK